MERGPIRIDDPLEGVFEVRVLHETEDDCWPFETNLEGRYPVHIEGSRITFAGTTAYYDRDSNTSTISSRLFECIFGDNGVQRCRGLEWHIQFLNNNIFVGTIVAKVSMSGGGALLCSERYPISAYRAGPARSY